eukprot:1055061-Heterocapsa_arctica.AAC.1
MIPVNPHSGIKTCKRQTCPASPNPQDSTQGVKRELARQRQPHADTEMLSAGRPDVVNLHQGTD